MSFPQQNPRSSAGSGAQDQLHGPANSNQNQDYSQSRTRGGSGQGTFGGTDRCSGSWRPTDLTQQDPVSRQRTAQDDTIPKEPMHGAFEEEFKEFGGLDEESEERFKATRGGTVEGGEYTAQNQINE